MARAKKESTARKKAAPRRHRWQRLDLAFWAVIAIGVILLVVLVPWQDIGAAITRFFKNVWYTFGWGLALMATAAGTLAWLVWTRRFPLLIRHWNQWLGGIVLLFAAWGILALVGEGGNFGDSLVGEAQWAGYARVAGMLALSAVLVAPEILYHLLVRPVRWWRSRPRQPRVVRPRAQRLKRFTRTVPPGAPPTFTLQPPPAPAPPARPEPRPAVKPEPKPTSPQPKAVTPQLARDVWQRYGETAKPTPDGWRLPPLDILDSSSQVEISQADNIKRARLIEEALASYGVEARVVQINAGPTVTQFGVEPGWDRRYKEIRERDRDGNIRIRTEEVSNTRVKVDRITALANDLALALAAPSIRIEAPVPGKSVVGIEVPNVTSTAVNLRSVVETNNFQKLVARSSLAIALGKGAGGEAEAADLARMPHLLIAGATGSGKTVCLNSIICCLLLHNSPNDLRLIMIDPKRVELTPYNTIPHLAIPVIVDTEKALDALRWLNYEMDKRYQQLARAGARNIDGYNKNRHGPERMPYLVLIIDELADLMLAGFDEVEHILCRLAQLARAVGIHLIVATQRPSVDVVTGLIKANFPTRISFAVTSQVDSRTILDGAGAEKLLGRGDMLFMPTEAAKPKRLQGSFVSDAEIERLVFFWGSQPRAELAPLPIEETLKSEAFKKAKQAPRDELLEAALELAREHGGRISTSFLQRRLQIGYPRAARLREQLDAALAEEAAGEPPDNPEEDHEA